eukprot:3218693-Rhodomonas_salina.1
MNTHCTQAFSNQSLAKRPTLQFVKLHIIFALKQGYDGHCPSGLANLVYSSAGVPNAVAPTKPRTDRKASKPPPMVIATAT